MLATWKQAARNVQTVLLFTLIRHQEHKFKTANLVQGVSIVLWYLCLRISLFYWNMPSGSITEFDYSLNYV